MAESKPNKDDLLLEVNDLTVRFPVKRGGCFGGKSYLYAVDDISFDVKCGETLAIVGESGSGKTTDALAVARLVEAHSGTVRLGDEDFLALTDDDLRKARAKAQIIFHDPYASLNPRLRAQDIVSEPIESLNPINKSKRQEVIDGLFKDVGLRPEQQRLFPHQFSGGQRQRIGIARALATQPELIICDEPVSALDVAVQAQIFNLLRKLQKERGLTFLCISHDLGIMQHMCDSIAVMYMGKIVEHADRKSLFNDSKHPYTQALLSAVPSADAKRRRNTKYILIPGDPPDPINPPKGCRFANRCPIAEAKCSVSQPPLRNVKESHKVACHLV